MKWLILLFILVSFILSSCNYNDNYSKPKGKEESLVTYKKEHTVNQLDSKEIINDLLDGTSKEALCDYIISEKLFKNPIAIDLNKVDTMPYNQIQPILTLDSSKFTDKVENGSGEIWDYALAENDLIYVIGYEKKMAVSAYKFEIYRYDISNSTNELLYTCDKEGLVVLNEMVCNDRYMFWVEETYEEGHSYTTLYSMNLITKEINILRRLKLMEEIYNPICLSVSTNYLTWYESKKESTDNEKLSNKIKVYNISDNSFEPVDISNVICFSPYVRLDIFDNNITFMTETQDCTIAINRYNLETQENISVALPKEVKLVDCSSNDNYFLWYESYNVGNRNYYLYNYNNMKLYKIDVNEKGGGFSYLLTDNLYLNYDNNHSLIKVDLSSFDIFTLLQDLETHFMHFQLSSNNTISIKGIEDSLRKFYLLN
ncbi:hypothetical protein DW1_2789 [Proteiniborus sp. DW1]|uniref:hypothetical protein n=1 Tax=Proteiniborus sp. DW1 TaxID=1889883 RepID=UPI00092E160C|nr:hypothetical protein [Proteiniborus sp. DW1]SCG84349.1 hypothetical protein DW1_2789 [Proteiniborus sp. DW1]